MRVRSIVLKTIDRTAVIVIDALFEVGLNAFFFNLIFILHPLFSDVIQMLGKYFGKKDHKMFPLELVVELS